MCCHGHDLMTISEGPKQSCLKITSQCKGTYKHKVHKVYTGYFFVSKNGLFSVIDLIYIRLLTFVK